MILGRELRDLDAMNSSGLWFIRMTLGCELRTLIVMISLR